MIINANLSATTTKSTCDSSCVNQSYISPLNLLARWPFDGNLADTTNNYILSSNAPQSFGTGYVSQALWLNLTTSQSLTTSYIPLANNSFTIDAWLYPTSYPNLQDHIIVALCPLANDSTCLHLTIRKNNSNYHLYFGFYNNDLSGATPVSRNKWTHVAFVFDMNNFQQSIYLNGLLDSSRNSTSPFLATTGDFTIGSSSMKFLENSSFEV